MGASLQPCVSRRQIYWRIYQHWAVGRLGKCTEARRPTARTTALRPQAPTASGGGEKQEVRCSDPSPDVSKVKAGGLSGAAGLATKIRSQVRRSLKGVG